MWAFDGQISAMGVFRQLDADQPDWRPTSHWPPPASGMLALGARGAPQVRGKDSVHPKLFVRCSAN